MGGRKAIVTAACRLSLLHWGPDSWCVLLIWEDQDGQPNPLPLIFWGLCFPTKIIWCDVASWVYCCHNGMALGSAAGIAALVQLSCNYSNPSPLLPLCPVLNCSHLAQWQGTLGLAGGQGNSCLLSRDMYSAMPNSKKCPILPYW